MSQLASSPPSNSLPRLGCARIAKGILAHGRNINF